MECFRTLKPTAGTRTHVRQEDSPCAIAIKRVTRDHDFLITIGMKGNRSGQVEEKVAPTYSKNLAKYTASLSADDYHLPLLKTLCPLDLGMKAAFLVRIGRWDNLH